MFPLQQSGELCFSFKVASNSSSQHPHQQHGVPQDFVFLDHGDRRREPSAESKDAVAAYSTEETRCRKTHAVHNKNENAVDEEGERKKKHREIEKQRRREMASLYAALRSLLPIEYVKGKRSISDHMNEAVNYIKHLHRKINELGFQRDKLKKLSRSSASGSTSRKSAAGFGDSVVEINHIYDGNQVEIIMSRRSDPEEDGDSLPLSTALEFLLEQGLDVIDCLTAKLNDRSLHRIHLEGSEAKFMHLGELQQKLHMAMN